ncbi:hypothetical protein FALBO_17135, partial [Fusarium albosuccineum]
MSKLTGPGTLAQPATNPTVSYVHQAPRTPGSPAPHITYHPAPTAAISTPPPPPAATPSHISQEQDNDKKDDDRSRRRRHRRSRRGKAATQQVVEQIASYDAAPVFQTPPGVQAVQSVAMQAQTQDQAQANAAAIGRATAIAM